MRLNFIVASIQLNGEKMLSQRGERISAVKWNRASWNITENCMVHGISGVLFCPFLFGFLLFGGWVWCGASLFAIVNVVWMVELKVTVFFQLCFFTLVVQLKKIKEQTTLQLNWMKIKCLHLYKQIHASKQDKNRNRQTEIDRKRRWEQKQMNVAKCCVALRRDIDTFHAYTCVHLYCFSFSLV